MMRVTGADEQDTEASCKESMESQFTGKGLGCAGHVQGRDSWKSVDETWAKGDGKGSRGKGEHQERGPGKEVD